MKTDMEFEYKIINRSTVTLDQLEQMLCDLGKQGWMLVAVDSPVVYLMRQVEEDVSADEPYYR